MIALNSKWSSKGDPLATQWNPTTHCPDDLTKGEEQDHAEGLHLIFDDDPTVYHLRTLCGSMALPLGPKLTADLRHKKVEAK